MDVVLDGSHRGASLELELPASIDRMPSINEQGIYHGNARMRDSDKR